MTAQDHNKTIGLLFLILGGLAMLIYLATAVICIFVGGAIIANERRFNDDAMGGVIVIVAGVLGGLFGIVIWGILPLIAGMKMRKNSPKARTWALIAAILALPFAVPIGTALGAYALWFLFSDHGKAFYSTGGAPNNFSTPPPNNWR